MANNFQSFFSSLNPFNQVKGIDPVKNLNGMISPVQLQRIRQDVLSWREAINESENAWYPHRVKMQRLFVDTILNGHVAACIERRKDLSMLRKFEFANPGGIVNEDMGAIFHDANGTSKKWVTDFFSYSLDALFFGYSLISLGDIDNDEYKDLSIIKRWNISPDRLNVTTLQYSIGGAPFEDEPYKDWHIYIPTVNEIGTSPCGYGLLYKIGIYEIFLRNLLGFNGDFVEMFAQPYRVGKTQKTNEPERAEFANALQAMGSAGWSIIDPQDEIIFLESALGGTGYKGYADLEKRCEQKISKLLLGHADALDSVPGKLGATQGNETPVNSALNDKQSKDGTFLENIVNTELLPRMIKMGFNIPAGVMFRFKNDSEISEIRDKEDVSNAATAVIALTMKNAGLKMDAKYFEDRTGIPTSEIAVVPPAPAFGEKITNKLKNLYK